MNRRSFVFGLGLSALGMSASRSDACGWRRRKKSYCPSSGSAQAILHCRWPIDDPTLTILIGGMLSAHDVRIEREKMQASQGYEGGDYMPPAPWWHTPSVVFQHNFYWTSHDRCWCNVYGRATGTDDYFGWAGNENPHDGPVRRAANNIWAICANVSKYHPLKRIRLVGHSAGCLVASYATWLKPQDTDISVDQVILLSPPVYPENHPDRIRKYPEYRLLFPKMSNIAEGKYYNFRANFDPVLWYFNVWQQCKGHPEIENHTDPDIKAAAKAETLSTTMLPSGHWAPCWPKTWDDNGLWDVARCHKSESSAV